jgi:hypothetical protein
LVNQISFSNINLSVGNNSNQLSAGHNHPYASNSHGDHHNHNNSNLTNLGNNNVVTSGNQTSNHKHSNTAHNVSYGTGNLDSNHINFYHPGSWTANNNAGAHHGNTTYAAFSHFHINPLTHDSRLLNINANTVPGLNAVVRMNPITANFSSQYKERLLEEETSKCRHAFEKLLVAVANFENIEY